MKTEPYGKQTRLSRPFRQSNRLPAFSEPALSRRQQLSAACRNKINALKERVRKQLAAQYANSLSATLLRRAIQEADALAATTLFPDLLLPVLAEEKVRAAYVWSKRQEQIQKETVSFAA